MSRNNRNSAYPQIRVRPETKQSIGEIAERHRLSLTETVHLLAQSFEALSPQEQTRLITGEDATPPKPFKLNKPEAIPVHPQSHDELMKQAAGIERVSVQPHKEVPLKRNMDWMVLLLQRRMYSNLMNDLTAKANADAA